MTRGVTLNSSLSSDPAIKRLNEYRSSWWWNFYSRDHHANRYKYTRAENNGPLRVFYNPCPLSCLSGCLGNGMREKVWPAPCQHSQPSQWNVQRGEKPCVGQLQWVGWCKKIRTDFITELERNSLLCSTLASHSMYGSAPRLPQWAPVAPGQLHWAALCLESPGMSPVWLILTILSPRLRHQTSHDKMTRREPKLNRRISLRSHFPCVFLTALCLAVIPDCDF